MATINDKMTAIADAIRVHTGGTEPLGLDAMAAAIAGLEMGGGIGEYKVISGSVTPTADISSGGYYLFRTGIPSSENFRSVFAMFFLDPENALSTSDKKSYELLYGYVFKNIQAQQYDSNTTTDTRIVYRSSSTTSDPSASTSTNYMKTIINNDEYCIYVAVSSSMKLIANRRYTWAVIRREYT